MGNSTSPVSVERAIQMAKCTLKKKLEADATLEFQELQATFHCVSAFLNKRPLNARILAGDVQAVTPNMLLLGRFADSRSSDPELLQLLQSEPLQSRAVSRLAVVKLEVDAWLEEFSRTAFPLLLTRDKCQIQIVHLRYDRQFKDHFCLAKIFKLLPEQEGMVLTVVVALSLTSVSSRCQKCTAGK